MEKLSLEILKKVQQKSKDLAIVMSIPGIGFISSSVVLSEIGNYRDFQTPDQLAKWCGLNPGENESAGKKEKMWNHKARFQAHQSCACPGCPDHIKNEKYKADQILPEVEQKRRSTM